VTLVVVGDALLDRDLDGHAGRLAPDAPVPVVDGVQERPRPGGAGLAAVLAAASGADVELVCAIGGDPAGRTLRTLLEAAGVRVHDVGLRGTTPEKVRVRAGDRPLVRLDHGDGRVAPGTPLPTSARRAIADASGVLVADYGRGLTGLAAVRAALTAVPPDTPIVWDPHPRGAEPVPGARLVTPNEGEAAAFARDTDAENRVAAETGGAAGAAGAVGRGRASGHASRAARARAAEAHGRGLAARWRAVAVAVTLGPQGAVLVCGDAPPLAVPGAATAGDPCGAGDCFAATAAVRLAAGALPSEAVVAGVEAAGAFVAAGGASGAARRGFGPAVPRPSGALALAARVRAAGGTVVATGGCFDLLHAGHVHTLEAARSFGDCLIVCLNGDESVRRLKGPDRPLVPEADRAAVLAGLRCVDAVAIFDEDDPREILRALRPHLWVKGGDYAASELPEAGELAGWGGRALTVPYLAGRSTSALVGAARTEAA
jgi:D-beta-D-heptose 7-phosphate kinase / D-beta-D-heptose 1-phosphate adenosyltransferase